MTVISDMTTSKRRRCEAVPIGITRLNPPSPDHFRVWDGIKESLRLELLSVFSGCEPWPIYLFGKAGVGKTCAVLACLDRVQGWASYVTLERLSQVAFTDDFWWTAIRGADFVVIDEIGEYPTRYDYVALKRVADWREFSPTIYISNLSAESLRNAWREVDRPERIFSRICCGTVLEVTDRDRRME